MDGHRISIAGIATERFWQIAVLTAAGAIGVDFPRGGRAVLLVGLRARLFPKPARAGATARPQSIRPRQAKKRSRRRKDSVKPQGPLVIAISIERQTLKVYDANGFFAETPISTGMKGHPTPMGVFSIIQKHKLHHSNIYSGAPMPFMQRITWSGIAMHAGALPGYPASHGCIRMPMAFAARMWNWTKMGARVVITPGEITPARFSHPLLAAQKVAPQPQPTATLEPNLDAPPAAKADKAADAAATVKPAISEPRLELRLERRSRWRQAGDGRDAFRAVARPDPHRGRQRRNHTPVTMSDASSSAAATVRSAPPRLSRRNPKPHGRGRTGRGKARPDRVIRCPAVESKPSEAATAEIKPADAEAADKTERSRTNPR